MLNENMIIKKNHSHHDNNDDDNSTRISQLRCNVHEDDKMYEDSDRPATYDELTNITHESLKSLQHIGEKLKLAECDIDVLQNLYKKEKNENKEKEKIINTLKPVSVKPVSFKKTQQSLTEMMSDTIDEIRKKQYDEYKKIREEYYV